MKYLTKWKIATVALLLQIYKEILSMQWMKDEHNKISKIEALSNSKNRNFAV